MKTYTKIEKLIDARLAELSEEYDLDTDEVNEEREAIYKENGWSYDPFPEGASHEDEDTEEEAPCYMSMTDQLHAVGMRWSDFL